MIRYYKEISAEIILQKCYLNGSADSNRVVLYKYAHDVRNTVPSKQSRVGVLCLQLGDNILEHLYFEAQILIVSANLLKNVTSKYFVRSVKSVLYGGGNFLQRWEGLDQKYKVKIVTEWMGVTRV